MKTEDKFLLSGGLAFISLIIFQIIESCINIENLDYCKSKIWLDIILYITIFIYIWLIVSFVGFFIVYKLNHGTFPKSQKPNSQPIPSKLFTIAAILCFILPPIGLGMFACLIVYYKMR